MGPILEGSLVMRDSETGSQWSQLRGDAIDGKMKGAQLEFLPAAMMSWGAWLQEHPETTVLGLSRTSQNYDTGFYARDEGPRKNDRDRFCIGWSIDGQSYHCTFNTLAEKPVLNLVLEREPVAVVFDPKSTSARILSRRLGDRALHFVADTTNESRMKDDATGTTWNRLTGVAAEGALQGVALDHHVGILSFTRKWVDLHPDSRQVPVGASDSGNAKEAQRPRERSPNPDRVEPFFQCGFEDGRGESVAVLTEAFAEGERNRIVPYSDAPVPRLPGAGERLVEMRLREGTTNHPDFVWYRKSHASREIYARMYFFLPDGHWEAGGGNGLKFFGVHGDGEAESPFNQAQTKLAPVGENEFRLVTTKVGKAGKKHYGVNTIRTGEWHLAEVHVRIDPEGEDLYEAWLDRDSRFDQPSIRFGQDVLFPDQQGKFSRVSNNKNSAGTRPPVSQSWFLDELAASTSPVGDTLGLLKSRKTGGAKSRSR